MPELFEATIEDQIAELERELAMRHRLYPMWVAQKKLKPATAERQLTAMEAVLKTVRSAK